MAWIEWWADAANVIWWQVVVVGSLIWLYQGARSLVMRTETRRATLKILVAGVFCAALGSMNLWVAKTLGTLIPQKAGGIDGPLREDWGAEAPPEEREKSSRIAASMAFVASGVLIKYVDRAGTWRDYCPTVEDRHRIADEARVRAQVSAQSEEAYSSAVRTWAAGITALLLGWLGPRVSAAMKGR